ncbi:putative Ig domain-containing protein [Streptomyces sp. 110]|uniref:Ig domain-containing protein n=2 Tax=Streptomyces endocoffeicus TaxID=2898945 RepID=A0ABS1Q5T2_9ACTN|nr:putative Ig domain-containing protein [Streptomyces endocoffeicus]
MDRRGFLITSGLSSFATIAGPAIAEPAFAAQGGRPSRIEAGFLSVGLDRAGRVVGLVDLRDGTDYYLAAGRSVPLVSVVLGNGEHEAPACVKVSAGHPRVLVFSSDKVRVKVKVANHAMYSTLEVIGLKAAPGVDVQTLLWGPLTTSVTETVGEDIGVVGNSRFAFGIIPLNDKTVGAWPKEFDELGFGSDVLSLPYGQSGTQNDWSAGAKTSWGSILRAYTYDYSKVRIREGEMPIGPLPGSEGQILGSKLAVFGTAPDLVLTVLSQVAQHEDQPYPTINGQWQKVARPTRQPFLTLHDLSTTNLASAIKFAQQAGIKNVYSVQGSAGPWKSTGHYQFNSNFGGSDAAATQMVATAAASGMRVGVHTLSNFISGNDPYIVPPPADKRLTTGLTVKLTRPLAAAETTLYADGSSGGGRYIRGHRLRIGNEFLTYSGMAQISGTEWQFTGVKRAQWGSAAASYPAGTSATRIAENQYGGARGDLPIIDEIATRLATAFNTTGIRNVSYDGLEEASWNGWSGHGFAHLVNGVYRRLKSQDNFISEASNLSSNTWFAQSRISWGGIGWGDSNYEQVKRNVNFYRANYFPPMGGSLPIGGNTSTLSIEQSLALGASLGANFGWFQTSVSGLSGGSNTTAILAAIKTWNSAIAAGAFTPAQQKLMTDQKKYWHLSEVTAGKKWSLQELDSAGTPVGAAHVVEAPKPGFTTPEPSKGRVGELYGFKVTSSTPQTVRYEVTSGALPAGLTLNKDTGGITGIPTTPGARQFTITARNSDSVPDAAVTYRLSVTPAADRASQTRPPVRARRS